MKKIFLILIFFISSCNYKGLKLTQDFEEYSEVEYIKTPKKIITTETKIDENQIADREQKVEFDENKNNKKKYDDNLLNRSQDGEVVLYEEDNKYLKPKVGRNFESNNLTTPLSSNRKIKVAMLLPLSGKNKDLGWSIYNSASLSLFDNDPSHKIEIVLFDSKDSTEDNQKAFKEIIDRKIKVVIGPIFSASTMSIEKMARDNDITVISLSNNHELLNKNNDDGGVFVGGILLESQIDKIVNYSMDRGKLNFAIIAPSNQYGKIITEYLKKFVKYLNLKKRLTEMFINLIEHLVVLKFKF